MKENQLKTKKVGEFLKEALDSGEITEFDKEILERIFKKKQGIMMKIC